VFKELKRAPLFRAETQCDDPRAIETIGIVGYLGHEFLRKQCEFPARVMGATTTSAEPKALPEAILRTFARTVQTRP
jgi:hypothetical protein